MTLHPFDRLPLADCDGCLILTPCPGIRGVELQEAVGQLKAAGASAVITLMPEPELERKNVLALPDVCRHQGLKWFHLPIQNDCAPEALFTERWGQYRQSIQRLLSTGQTIAVHCKGGSGRTGLMVAMILMGRGVPLADAVETVQRLRPEALGNPAQLKYLQHSVDG